MDYESEYRRYKQLYLSLVRQLGGGDDESLTPRLKKLMKKHIERLDEKGRSFIFFHGKPIIAKQSPENAEKKMRETIRKNPGRYRDEILVKITIATHRKNAGQKNHGGIRLMIHVFSVYKGRKGLKIGPRDDSHSMIRVFYNRDELADFKLSELKKFAIAAENRNYKNTGIGHYQYTEAKELW